MNKTAGFHAARMLKIPNAIKIKRISISSEENSGLRESGHEL
jgi:hypothetical protein